MLNIVGEQEQANKAAQVRQQDKSITPSSRLRVQIVYTLLEKQPELGVETSMSPTLQLSPKPDVTSC